jgi:hypothetical protein
MKFLKKREGPAQNLAYLGLMCALNCVMATLATLVPLSSFFVILLLPLVSALAIALTEDKYALVYLVAALGLSLSVTAYDITETLFYVLPAIVMGTFYGFLLKKGCPTAFLLVGSAAIQTGLNYAALPLIKLLSGQDFIVFMENLLGLAGEEWIDYILLSLIFAYSLIEVILSHLAMTPLMHKLGIVPSSDEKINYLYEILTILFGALAIGLGFAVIPVAYLALELSLYFLVFSLLTYFRKLPWWTYLLLGLAGGTGFVLFSCLYRFMPPYAGLLLGGVIAIFFAIPCLLVRLLFKSVPSDATPQ